VNRRLVRIAARLVGVALVALVLWLVGWNDRVRDVEGSEHVGRLVRVTADRAVLDTDSGERTVKIGSPERDVTRGLAGAFANLRRSPGAGLGGAAALLLSMVYAVFRWRALLRGAGLRADLRETTRLAWVGLFFNQVLPMGQVGGDVVKAYALAKNHPGRRGRAVVSVLFDRGVGLIVLFTTAAAGVALGPRGTRVDLARGIALATFAACAVCLGWMLLPRLRDRFPVSRLLGRLPFRGMWLAAAEGFDVYGRNPRAVGRALLWGIGVHAAFLLGLALLGRALGAELNAFALLVAIPVALMAGSLPGLPAGWGVGDMAFWFFLPAAGVPPNEAVALSFTMRAVIMLFSLPGGLFLASAERTAATSATA